MAIKKTFSEIDHISNRTIVMILGGGQGSRLYPLTRERSKPAVPLGGKFRLIDLPLSNCLHSGLDKVYVLTQFNSDSLHRHITQTYRFDPFSRGFVQILAAQQTMDNMNWYQGTADAVRQAMHRLMRHTPEHVIILSGDHLYRMDFRALMRDHIENQADVTIATLPVHRERCSDFGILQVNERKQITSFVEKPKDPAELERLAMPDSLLKDCGGIPGGRRHIASMGIYAFKTEVLRKALNDYAESDFGKNIIPAMIEANRVFAHFFDGYWEDIGTIRSFYDANLSLTETVPPFNFYDEGWPIYTRPRFLPGAKINNAMTRSSVICDGAIISGAVVENSIVGLRGIVADKAQIYETIMMGADYYEHAQDIFEQVSSDAPPLGVGPRTIVRKAIIDKNARIGADCKIINENNVERMDGDNFFIRDGVIVIPKSGVIKAGTVI